MKRIEIRGYRDGGREPWLRLRAALWPDETPEDLEEDADVILGDPDRYGVVFAVDTAGSLVGFAEVSVREWAEGCRSRPVAYLEAWYVAPEHRRSGVGRELVEAAERWARERGLTEMGSDALLDNHLSHRAHAALGFTEVERVVLFAKHLPD